jgi:predicted nucleic acid-binding protein
MSSSKKIYCLDANVLIEAWQKYYSPKFCPQYWEILNSLGGAGRIFIPEVVFEEITRTEDDLCEWLKGSKIPIRKIDEAVIKCWQDMLSRNPSHQTLVDSIKGRSLADPWVIAHAINEKATVVTKETKNTAVNSSRIRIPNVCDNMSVAWINDFELIAELGIQFSCTLSSHD